MYIRQKSALGYKWILMYCTIEQDWLKGVLNDSDKVIELEHLPTTTVKNVGPEVILFLLPFYLCYIYIPSVFLLYLFSCPVFAKPS